VRTPASTRRWYETLRCASVFSLDPPSQVLPLLRSEGADAAVVPSGGEDRCSSSQGERGDAGSLAFMMSLLQQSGSPRCWRGAPGSGGGWSPLRQRDGVIVPNTDPRSKSKVR
jgi:hypothetical protein